MGAAPKASGDCRAPASLLLLRELQVDVEGDLVLDREAALGQRSVPVEAELVAVHRGGEIDADALLAGDVLDRPDDRAAGLDGPAWCP